MSTARGVADLTDGAVGAQCGTPTELEYEGGTTGTSLGIELRFSGTFAAGMAAEQQAAAAAAAAADSEGAVAVAVFTTATVGAVSAGATSVSVADISGIVVGNTMEIGAAGAVDKESTTVVSVVVGIPSDAGRERHRSRRAVVGTVTIAGGLQNSHADGSAVMFVAFAGDVAGEAPAPSPSDIFEAAMLEGAFTVVGKAPSSFVRPDKSIVLISTLSTTLPAAGDATLAPETAEVDGGESNVEGAAGAVQTGRLNSNQMNGVYVAVSCVGVVLLGIGVAIALNTRNHDRNGNHAGYMHPQHVSGGGGGIGSSMSLNTFDAAGLVDGSPMMSPAARISEAFASTLSEPYLDVASPSKLSAFNASGVTLYPNSPMSPVLGSVSPQEAAAAAMAATMSAPTPISPSLLQRQHSGQRFSAARSPLSGESSLTHFYPGISESAHAAGMAGTVPEEVLTADFADLANTRASGAYGMPEGPLRGAPGSAPSVSSSVPGTSAAGVDFVSIF